MLALGRQRKQRTHVNRKRRMPCINLCASDVHASSNRGSFVSIHHSPHIYLCTAQRYKSRRASKPICVYSTASFASIRAIDTRDVHKRHLLRLMRIPADVMRQRGCKLEIQCKFDAWCLGMMLFSYLRNVFDVRWRMRFMNGFRAFWSIAAFLHSTDALIALSLRRHWRFLRRTIFPQSSLNDYCTFAG